MRLGVVSESLGHLPYAEAVRASAELGLAGLEIGMGNWCAAPHADLQRLLESTSERDKFLTILERSGLELAALNCSGNQLHPVAGVFSRDPRKSLAAAQRLSIPADRICADYAAMAGAEAGRSTRNSFRRERNALLQGR